MIIRLLCLVIAVSIIGGCSSVSEKESTIKSLEKKSFVSQKSETLTYSKASTIEKYQSYVDNASKDMRHAEALRRLADLQLELGEESGNQKNITGNEASYYQAISSYNALLDAYPEQKNDRILYQLARAYVSTGQPDRAINSLSQLISTYPGSTYKTEAMFRRAEILFALKDYKKAEQDFRDTLAQPNAENFLDKARSRVCWSLFKQEHYENSVTCFIDILDTKLASQQRFTVDRLDQLNPVDRKSVDEALYVISLSFSYASRFNIESYLKTHRPVSHANLLYASLADLYMLKERYIDAADTYNAFIRNNPYHLQSPRYSIRAIDALRHTTQNTLVLKNKHAFVKSFGPNSTFWQKHSMKENPDIEKYLKATLVELAKHHHSLAQQDHSIIEFEMATSMYQQFLTFFGQDQNAAGINFLYAELLYEFNDFAEAARQYEKTAYQYPAHDQGAEAGYAALLAFEKYQSQLDASKKPAAQRLALQSALKFTEHYPDHPNTLKVTARAAASYFRMKQYGPTIQLANKLLQSKNRISDQMQFSAWLMIGHASFEENDFKKAEFAYSQALDLAPKNNSRRKEIVENLATAIYKQGEALRDAGELNSAAEMFLKVGDRIPDSIIYANAEYSAAKIKIAQKLWPQAISILDQFTHRFPDHALSDEVYANLVVAYEKSGQPIKEANMLEQISRLSKDIAIRKEALWRAAEIYRDQGLETSAVTHYKRFIDTFPKDADNAMEARQYLADLNRQLGHRSSYYHWLREIVKADHDLASQRSERSRYLAAKASVILADSALDAYQSINLKVPLEKSLRVKKKHMKKALDQFNKILGYQVGSVTTEATYRIAEIYNNFGQSLMSSERPQNLTDDELEEYNLLLEEQAFPFEEQAIKAHESNITHVQNNYYDEWIRQSYEQLSELHPARYKRMEKHSEIFDDLY
ncbi:MAG: tetratricopeptide repeat protein [Gammaproteobacteria bacterium]